MTDIQHVRTQVDRLDRRIVGLLADRERLVRQAGRLKTGTAAVRAPGRVEEVVARVRAIAAEAGASPDVAERTYRAMIAAFIDLELATLAHPEEIG
ncbi:chorismate mutase [Actinomadura sp. DC4]|uniref:chorismate mutase n=1 Tax=Actinomadura sp. DC4 TaxID=3055069 RepID=UPI0025B1D20D|nr:chorismate mutase [Actinomadura sp. DC4]MDN3353395.1 chorismate mutase [Actinomadura sp. DC4]